LKLDFCNPSLSEPKDLEFCITKTDMDELIKMFTDKYGTPDETNSDNTIRKWYKGQLEIILRTHFLGVSYADNQHYYGSASYNYIKNIQEKIDKEEKQENKKI